MKHLLRLRTAFRRGAPPVEVRYRHGGKTGVVHFTGNGFAHARKDELLSDLRALWLARNVEIRGGEGAATGPRVISVVDAVSQSVNGMAFSEHDAAAIHELARALPPVKVRLYPLYRHGLRDFNPYLRMQVMFVGDGEVRLDQYLLEGEERGEGERYMRVFLAVLLLGLIGPAAPRRTEGDAARTGPSSPSPAAAKAAGGLSAQERKSILSRIIRRVRGV